MTFQLDNQYAPIHRNAEAILREKTETAVRQVGPLITVSQTGLPATERVLKGLGPNTLLDQLGPFLEQLNPILVGSPTTSS